ncbi:sulfotransferase family 2 domain-containing protein [Peribacillus cavernae]|nr:sulfotransferase family 2 domain-containing protein [Peribacillus cavernae]MDQ0218886.1 hypothetical protein [Peribacillus cavernae]
MNDDQLVIFLHIQKTAGSSLITFIKKQYTREKTWFGSEDKLQALSQNETEGLSCIGGHFRYGIHEMFSKPSTYITMLRDPVDRIVSYYYYLLNRPDHGKYQRAKDLDFETFLNTFQTKTSNFQTRRITGGNPDLETAKKHLLENFSFVGLTERFEESLFLMKKEFDWTNTKYRNRNITSQRPDQRHVPDEVISLIEDNNKLDMELYRFAQDLFEKRIQSLDAKTKAELENHLKSN